MHRLAVDAQTVRDLLERTATCREQCLDEVPDAVDLGLGPGDGERFEVLPGVGPQQGVRQGTSIREGYGLSETSPLATFTPPCSEPRPGSIGKPVWGVEVDLIGDDWTCARACR
ncbi:AMP-binding protein [Stenotrophomonas sp. NPDC087984]